MVSLRTFLTRFTAVTALVPAAALGLQAPSHAAGATKPRPTPTATAKATVTPTPPATSRTAGLWQPPVDSRWQYQLQGSKTYASTGGVNVDICGVPQNGGACVRPSVFDIDLYAAAEVTGNNTTLNTAAVKAIHAKGAKAICYIDAGSIEDFRPDYQTFLDWHNAHGKSLLGKPFSDEFPNERWANINNDKGQRDFLLKMMAARADKCVQAGFDGIEFDVVNAHEEGKSVTGWTVSPATQLTYNKALAAIAHARGLSVALKNDLSQAEELVSSFDYAVNEECFQFDECSELNVFIKAGKPVFHVEYATAPSSFCAKSKTLKFNSLKKPEDYSLYDKPYAPCR